MMAYKYSFHDYSNDILNLYRKIVDSGTKYDLVVGVARGGVIPAVHLSHLLEVPYATLQWSTAKDRVQERSNPHIMCAKGPVLIVDDIVDDGGTMRGIMESYPQCDTASLLLNVTNRYNVVPTFTSWSFSREDVPQWIDFWWETIA